MEFSIFADAKSYTMFCTMSGCTSKDLICTLLFVIRALILVIGAPSQVSWFPPYSVIGSLFLDPNGCINAFVYVVYVGPARQFKSKLKS